MTINLDLFNNALNSYIVKPLNAFGVGGFLFDVEAETSVTLASDITDHFLEDNSFIQDHITIKPKTITLKGYIGELVYRNENQDPSIAQKVTQKLTVASQYLPELSSGVKQIRDIARRNKEEGVSLKDVRLDSVNRITDFYAFAKNNIPPTSKQQQAYMYFKALQEGKFLVSVQTPFEFMNRMAIETIVAKQDEGSRFISDFTITLKEIRTVSLLRTQEGETQYRIEENSEDNLQGRAEYQRAGLEIIGNTSGSALPVIDDDPLAAFEAARAARAEFLSNGNPFEINDSGFE